MWVLTNTWAHNNEFTGVCMLIALSERESGIPSTLGTGLQCTLYFLLVFIELYRSIWVVSSLCHCNMMLAFITFMLESRVIRIYKENRSGLG